MSEDPLLNMFNRATSLRKAAEGLDTEDQKDYPGATKPRNRPGGEAYQERREAKVNEKTYEFATKDGEVKTFYTIKTIARIFGRKTVTIRAWEDKGIMPKPKFRTPAPKGPHLGAEPKGRRLYTQNQVDYLLLLCKRYRMLEQNTADWKGFQKAMQYYHAD